MLTDRLEWSGLLVDYCGVFISCLDSHSDGTHSLQSIHCWTSDAMLHFSKSDEETNSSTSWMAWKRLHFQQIFILGWTVPLNAWCNICVAENQVTVFIGSYLQCTDSLVSRMSVKLLLVLRVFHLHKHTHTHTHWVSFRRTSDVQQHQADEQQL